MQFGLLVILVAASLGQTKQDRRFPAWLPSVAHQSETSDPTAAGHAHSSYKTDADLGHVVGHYETALRDAYSQGVTFTEDGSENRTTFDISSSDYHCTVAVMKAAPGTNVDVMCTSPLYTQAVTAAPAKIELRPGYHVVEYVIEGTAAAAGLTFHSASGATQHSDIDLPATLLFQATPGVPLMIAAQNKAGQGTLRVSIKIDGATVRQAESSQPYGLASTSTILENHK